MKVALVHRQQECGVGGPVEAEIFIHIHAHYCASFSLLSPFHFPNHLIAAASKGSDPLSDFTSWLGAESLPPPLPICASLEQQLQAVESHVGKHVS